MGPKWYWKIRLMSDDIAADIFALALDIQQSTTRMIELMFHINELRKIRTKSRHKIY
jgi:hypothetical protein